jgi:hypothetical protein
MCLPGGHTKLKVAAELEARWNASLTRVRQMEQDIQRTELESPAATPVAADELLGLAQQLPAIWDASATDSSIKQRIVGILIEEIVVDVDDTTNEVLLFIQFNLEEASKRLKVSASVVRRLIQLKILPTTQVVVGARWQIALTDADSSAVIKAAQTLQRREVLREPCKQQTTPCLPGFEDVHDRTAF